MKTDTASLFNTILESSLFRLNGPGLDLCQRIMELCHAIESEEETDWSLGEFQDCTLDSFLIGAYWSLAEWHGGQASPEYAALCAIGSIFSPGHTSPPASDGEPEYWPYVAVNNHFAKINNRPEEIKL
jgi:hypothetical protein